MTRVCAEAELASTVSGTWPLWEERLGAPAVTAPSTAATSWYEEFRRLYDTVPCVEVQTLREHTDQVLHLSFSHSGCQFASCSKDCTVKVREPRGAGAGPVPAVEVMAWSQAALPAGERGPGQW